MLNNLVERIGARERDRSGSDFPTLAALGVPGADLDDLLTSLRADGDPGTDPGPATKGWVASLAMKVVPVAGHPHGL